MAQITARAAIDVVHWTDTTAHCRGAWDGWANNDPGFFVLDGCGDKLRVPVDLMRQVFAAQLLEVAPQLERRMYRPSRKGKRLLAQTSATETQQ